MVVTVRSETELRGFFAGFQGQVAFIKASARWCGPCQQVGEGYERLAEEICAVTREVAFLQFDVDDAPDLQIIFRVASVPTFCCMFQDGGSRYQGSSTRELAAWMKLNVVSAGITSPSA